MHPGQGGKRWQVRATFSLPDDIRERFYEHLADLRDRYSARGWGGTVGMGERPAVIVIDLAERWVNPDYAIGSDLEGVVANTARLLDTARETGIPIFFTTMATDPGDPPHPNAVKSADRPGENVLGGAGMEIDPRLGRRSNEKLIVKKQASSFRGTDLQDMLSALRVDTVIITGCSTSHCVYATCRDAAGSYRVISEETVGDRCEVMHAVNLLDIEISIGDVLPVETVIEQVKSLKVSAAA